MIMNDMYINNQCIHIGYHSVIYYCIPALFYRIMNLFMNCIKYQVYMLNKISRKNKITEDQRVEPSFTSRIIRGKDRNIRPSISKHNYKQDQKANQTVHNT